MATWYVDYETGTDVDASAGNGDSYATRRKTVTRCVAAAIAPGDTIRVMGSPAPTSLGINGTWTNGPLPAVITITSSTNATPIVVTLTTGNYTALAPAVGDTVMIYGHVTNTNANGTWEISAVNGSTTLTIVNADGSNSVANGAGTGGSIRKATNRVVKLASALTANIAVFGNQGAKLNWTASTNVTCTVITSDFREGGECQQIAVGASFTTGKAAYFATGTLDLSAYQQISLRFKQTAGTIGAAGACTVSLCSDTAGATPVNTFNLPNIGALNQWMPVTLDNGAALGSSIQSIALNVVTDNGAQTFLIDNVIACKAASAADSLSLTSLIGKNTANETWYPIQSINSVRVMLDAGGNWKPNDALPSRGYSGTTETITTYKRETIKTVPVALSTDNAQVLQDSGTVGNLITISGGWNRTNMSSQDGETWFDGQNNLGYGFYASTKNFYSLDLWHGVRYTASVNFYLGNNIAVGELHANGCASTGPLGGIYISQANMLTATKFVTCNNHGNGVYIPSSSGIKITEVISHNNGSVANASGIDYGTSAGGVVYAATCKNNYAYGVIFQAGSLNTVNNLTTSGNGTAGVRNGNPNNTAGTNYIRSASIAEAIPVSTKDYTCGRLWSEKHGGQAGDDRLYVDGGLVLRQQAVRHTESGYAYSLAVSSATRDVNYPLSLPIAQVACAANALVTVKAWMRRSDTGLTMRLSCYGGQLDGIPNLVQSSMTAAADTWEELTITFTPTEAGVVEIMAEAYGGTGYTGYVDDLTITQA